MSGYDFLSGFLGSLGDQMKDKEARKRAIEDEDRQYQRKLSFEEAVAASRERQQIAAQERADKRARLNTPPTMREFTDEKGVLKQAPSRYFDGKWHDEGEAADVPQRDVGEAYEVNGRRMQPQRFGPPRDTGASEKGLNRAAQNSRNATSAAATLEAARISASNNPKTDLDALYRKELRPVMTLFTGTAPQKDAVRKMYGLDDNATAEDVKAAVRASVDPNYTPPKKQETLLDVFGNTARSMLNSQKTAEPSNYPELADEIAKGRKMFAGGDDATEDEIVEALVEAGILVRKK